MLLLTFMVHLIVLPFVVTILATVFPKMTGKSYSSINPCMTMMLQDLISQLFPFMWSAVFTSLFKIRLIAPFCAQSLLRFSLTATSCIVDKRSPVILVSPLPRFLFSSFQAYASTKNYFPCLEFGAPRCYLCCVTFVSGWYRRPLGPPNLVFLRF